MLIAVLPLFAPPFDTWRSFTSIDICLGCLGLNDALLCCVCLFTVRANNALVRTTGGVVSAIFIAFTVVLAGGGG